MKFARPLLVFALDDVDVDGPIALLRAIGGDARELVVRVCVPGPGSSLGEPDLVGFEQRLEAADERLAALRARLGAEGIAVTGEAAVGPAIDVASTAIAAEPADLVVFGWCGVDVEVVAGFALELSRSARVVTACLGGAAPPAHAVQRSLHPFDGRAESLASIGALLRDHGDANDTVVLLATTALDPRLRADPAMLAAVAGIRAQLESAPSPGGWLDALRAVSETPSDILVLSADAVGVAADVAVRVALRALARGPRPLLFAPPLSAEREARDGELDSLDAFACAESIAIRVERVGSFGAPAPIAAGTFVLVAGGRVVASVEARAGVLRVPAGALAPGPIGIGRAVPGLDPLGAIEAAIVVDALPAPRVALVDARIDGELLDRVRAALDDGARALVAVRVAPDTAARQVRARWIAAGFASPRVLDVRELLDEGDPTDVPQEVAAVRLARAAARLRAEGVQVDVVVTLDPARAHAVGFALLAAAALDDATARIDAAWIAPPAEPARTLAARLDVLTASRVNDGNRVHVDLDNADARRALIALVDGARTRVHAQWYMVEDDEVSREVEAALVRAAGRGVDVRVLCDSLYSRHGSLGAENALLARLARVPGVAIHASRRIDHVPSLEELKQRDHRKLMIVDGVSAIIGGRNLGRAYYRSFEEARVSAASTYRDLPWLDASATIEGPAAVALDDVFREAWIEAGGDGFDLAPRRQVGTVGARVVVHRGLRDAYTLEAYRAIVDAARTRILVANNFPLQLEMQHALLSALERGVRVALLVGRVRPAHGDDVPFSGGTIRALADALIRARLAALVDAGADVRELALPPPPGWDPELGVVRPHVHAKIVCADGQVLAIGSANLDVTAGYWESEALVILDDPAVVRGLQARLDTLFSGSTPIDRDDPKWRDGAALREWLGRVWPSIVG